MCPCLTGLLPPITVIVRDVFIAKGSAIPEENAVVLRSILTTMLTWRDISREEEVLNKYKITQGLNY
jgi:hypothetical protein